MQQLLDAIGLVEGKIGREADGGRHAKLDGIAEPHAEDSRRPG